MWLPSLQIHARMDVENSEWQRNSSPSLNLVWEGSGLPFDATSSIRRSFRIRNSPSKLRAMISAHCSLKVLLPGIPYCRWAEIIPRMHRNRHKYSFSSEQGKSTSAWSHSRFENFSPNSLKRETFSPFDVDRAFPSSRQKAQMLATFLDDELRLLNFNNSSKALRLRASHPSPGRLSKLHDGTFCRPLISRSKSMSTETMLEEE